MRDFLTSAQRDHIYLTYQAALREESPGPHTLELLKHFPALLVDLDRLHALVGGQFD